VAQNVTNIQGNSVQITVSATIQGSIELITIQTLDFHNNSEARTLIEMNPVTNPNAGKMVARGTPGAEFRLNYLKTRELTNTSGLGVIFFEYDISANNIDEQETSELLDQEGRPLTFNENGEFFIWVGGSVDLSSAQPGSYEGEFTIEIEYI
jgi:hypothetical protein